MREYYGRSIAIDRTVEKRRGRIRPLGIVAALVVAAFIVTLAATAPLLQTAPSPEKMRILFSPITICSDGDVGQYSSLTLDPTNPGDVIIAHYNATEGDLMITLYTGAWSSFTACSVGDVGNYCSIDCNSTGVNMVSHYNATTGDLNLGTSTGERTCVDNSSNDVGMFSSIIISANDSIAISYYDATAGDLKVAYNRSGNTPWVVYTVDTGGDVGQYSDAWFYPMNDSLSICYYDATNGDLKNAYAWDTGSDLSAWQNIPIESVGDAGKWSDQAGLASSAWYCSWYKVTGGDLSFAYWYTPTDYEWNVFPDTVGDVGQYTSIAVNSTGRAFISYYDNTNKDLKLAWNTSKGVWYNMTLDSVGDVGKFTSLRIDPSDAIHISYYDADNGDLKYVKVVASDLVMIPEFGDILLPMAGIVITALAISSMRRRKAA